MKPVLAWEREARFKVERFPSTPNPRIAQTARKKFGLFTDFVFFLYFFDFLARSWPPQAPGGIQMAPDRNSASVGGPNTPWGFFWTRFGHRDNAKLTLVQVVLCWDPTHSSCWDPTHCSCCCSCWDPRHCSCWDPRHCSCWDPRHCSCSDPRLVEAPDIALPETRDIAPVETQDLALVETQDIALVETQDISKECSNKIGLCNPRFYFKISREFLYKICMFLKYAPFTKQF